MSSARQSAIRRVRRCPCGNDDSQWVTVSCPSAYRLRRSSSRAHLRRRRRCNLSLGSCRPRQSQLEGARGLDVRKYRSPFPPLDLLLPPMARSTRRALPPAAHRHRSVLSLRPPNARTGCASRNCARSVCTSAQIAGAAQTRDPPRRCDRNCIRFRLRNQQRHQSAAKGLRRRGGHDAAGSTQPDFGNCRS